MSNTIGVLYPRYYLFQISKSLDLGLQFVARFCIEDVYLQVLEAKTLTVSTNLQSTEYISILKQAYQLMVKVLVAFIQCKSCKLLL